MLRMDASYHGYHGIWRDTSMHHIMWQLWDSLYDTFIDASFDINESCHTWMHQIHVWNRYTIRCHFGMSRVTHRCIITRTWMHHITEEWVMLRMDASCNMKESCHTWMHQIHVLYRYKMRYHLKISRVAPFHEYECIMPYQWVMSHLDASIPCIIYIQHETSRRNESCCVISQIWWMPHIIRMCHKKIPLFLFNRGEEVPKNWYGT